MNDYTKTKELTKIMFAAAWIDGSIQPQERQYLHRMAIENGVAEDPEIKALLSEIKPIKPTECYQWLENYLGDNHTHEDYESLLEAISALIYSDGDVQISEANLLTKLQGLDPDTESKKSIFDKLLVRIQKLYRQGIHQNV